MANKFSIQTAAITAISAITASVITFFVTKHIFTKKPETSPITDQLNSISSDISDLKTNITQKKSSKSIAKTTDDIQENNVKEWSSDEQTENLKKFHKFLTKIQDNSFDKTHKKNFKTMYNYITKSNTVDNNSKILHKTEGEPLQNIFVENYYEIETNKVRSIFIPIYEFNDIKTFYENIKKNLYEKIDSIENINLGEEINKENSKKIKTIIDAYCFKNYFKSILNESLNYADSRNMKITGFFISEQQL